MKDRSSSVILKASNGVDPTTINPPLTDDELKLFNEVKEMIDKAKKEGRTIIIEPSFDVNF